MTTGLKMKTFAIFVLVVILVGVCHGAGIKPANSRKSYEGYKVLKATPRTDSGLKFLRSYRLDDPEVIIANRPRDLNMAVDLLVSSDRIVKVAKELKQEDIDYTIQVDNVQPSVDRLYEHVDSKRKVFDLNNFNTLDDINIWLGNLQSQCRAGLTCIVESVGNAYGGEPNPINVFRISKAGAGRKGYYVDATTQSSDWIATSTALNLIDALARGSNPEAIRLTDEYDWHIIPVVNPDGYEYSFASDRFWLKNRKPNGQCTGTNLNLNFDSEWGMENAGHSPCANDFCGVSPASEPETIAIQNEIQRLAPSLRGVLTLHAFGSSWVYPPHYTVNHQGVECAVNPDDSALDKVASAAAAAAGATYGTTWAHGSACSVLGPSSGSMEDFAKKSGGIFYTFMIQLRGDSFVLDPSEIQPAYTEFFNGLVAMVDTIIPPEKLH